MDIRLLKTFCVVAKLENITQAAEILNFTQPTVSAQIRTLEEHFGVQLFERIGKKLYITNAGKALIDPSEKIIKIYSETVAQINYFSEVQYTRIGISSSYINYWLSPALLQMQTSDTTGKINVEICLNSNGVLDGVNNNKYDIGIVHDTISEKCLNTVIINSEELVWVGHENLIKDKACPRIDDYPVINFRQGCTFRKLCDKLLQERGLNSTFEYSDFDAVKNAMTEGLGIALLPRIVVENLIKENDKFYIFKEVSNLEIPLYTITRKDKNLSTTAHTLLRILQENKVAI
ncbi:LysR family transcriptional regulator [Dendrosporobacter sp. 1207_IL3150]|uniref:LysR family transcriptional regulator n=1 Tax=Dendrosporobacter sp. 1207_IL3150 TaxID=3084054 RepID=UPI002FD8ECD8